MTMRLDADGDRVVVVLPPTIPMTEALSLVESHRAWLAERLTRLPARVPFVDGAIIPFRGHPHRIHHDPRALVRISADPGIITVGGHQRDEEALSTRVAAWLRREARLAITRKVKEIGNRSKEAFAGDSPTIRIGDPTSRWGSCSSTGSLSFSWRLILAPEAVLTYVVGHELAHLKVRDHGPDFWAEVTRLVDDPRKERAWLRREGGSLFRYGPPRRSADRNSGNRDKR